MEDNLNHKPYAKQWVAGKIFALLSLWTSVAILFLIFKTNNVFTFGGEILLISATIILTIALIKIRLEI